MESADFFINKAIDSKSVSGPLDQVRINRFLAALSGSETGRLLYCDYMEKKGVANQHIEEIKAMLSLNITSECDQRVAEGTFVLLKRMRINADYRNVFSEKCSPNSVTDQKIDYKRSKSLPRRIFIEPAKFSSVGDRFIASLIALIVIPVVFWLFLYFISNLN